MEFRRILLPAAITLASLPVHAQDIIEAFNLGNTTVQGTARSMGIGNTLGSVGGDFSTISVNPAGLGVYRTSELTFTPSMRIAAAASDYLGTNTLDNKANFNINQFGIVFTDAPKGKRYDRRSWKDVSFAFGMNRVADFNRNHTYQGRNNTSSGTQAFESDANQYPNDVVQGERSALGYLGYESYLLNKNLNGDYVSVVPFSGGVNQQKTVRETGRIDEYVLALGGNYMEKLMLGMTLGMPGFRYSKQSTYTESLPADNRNNPDGFNSFSYTQNLDLTGKGVNLKLGAIYNLTSNFRVGAAFHSPTYYYTISDISTPGMVSVVNGTRTILSTDNEMLLQNQFDYTFTTPWRAILSGAYIMKGVGFLTLDYEYVDYNNMNFTYPDGQDFTTNYYMKEEQNAMNASLKNIYQGTSNIRLGGEAKLSKYFRIRAGVGYYGNAFRTAGDNSERLDVSGGFGFHLGHLFVDAGLVNSMYTIYAQPYSINYDHVKSGPVAAIPTSVTNFNVINAALTVGIKF